MNNNINVMLTQVHELQYSLKRLLVMAMELEQTATINVDRSAVEMQTRPDRIETRQPNHAAL